MIEPTTEEDRIGVLFDLFVLVFRPRERRDGIVREDATNTTLTEEEDTYRVIVRDPEAERDRDLCGEERDPVIVDGFVHHRRFVGPESLEERWLDDHLDSRIITVRHALVEGCDVRGDRCGREDSESGRGLSGLEENVHDFIGERRFGFVDVCPNEERTIKGALHLKDIGKRFHLTQTRQVIHVLFMGVDHALADERRLPVTIGISDEVGVFEFAEDVAERRSGNLEGFSQFRLGTRSLCEGVEGVVPLEDERADVGGIRHHAESLIILCY